VTKRRRRGDVGADAGWRGSGRGEPCEEGEVVSDDR